jgi:hypothetical protein
MSWRQIWIGSAFIVGGQKVVLLVREVRKRA